METPSCQLRHFLHGRRGGILIMPVGIERICCISGSVDPGDPPWAVAVCSVAVTSWQSGPDGVVSDALRGAGAASA